MPQMKKYLRWKQNEQIWKLSLALGQSGGSPWVGGALPSSGGSSGGYPLSMGALPFTAWKVGSPSDISINCPQTYEVGLASAPCCR